MRWLEDRDLPREGCVLDDGSGLSRENRLTAMAVTELLGLMDARHGEPWEETLAVAGRDGSLRRRMRGSVAEGRVFAKTGYIRGVSCLSGYVRARSGRRLAFSILMNGVPWGELWKARLAQDKVCIRVVNFRDGEGE
jgi:D-alanyl-D-alanine carboxypeptidase/D-alanyl-D-alanine-endopeptidase (penicillin-binding protein 4)